MNLNELFTTPLFSDFLPIDNQKIIDFCYDYVEKFPSRQQSNSYQSFNLDLTDPSLIDLSEEIQSRANRIKTEFYRLKDDVDVSVYSSWFTINHPSGVCGSLAVPHIHSLNFLTCVYYLKADPNSGDLILISPHSNLDYAIPNQIKRSINEANSATWYLTPEPGKLVIFPAWIPHYVQQNASNNDRISIAVNFELRYKDQILDAAG